MFGRVVQPGAALATFVRAPALIAIRVMRFTALMVPMAARDIGLPIPVVGAIVGNRERFKSSPRKDKPV
jgi:hypothetical protein